MSCSSDPDVTRAFTVGAAVCATALAPSPCSATSVTLQTVDLTDKGMSIEGGETTLYRISNGKKVHCRIEAIHYGEGGKTIYGFAFNPRLFSATRREYGYNHPIYVDTPLMQRLTGTETLKTKGGAATLPAAFSEYRSFFDRRKLATCDQP